MAILFHSFLTCLALKLKLFGKVSFFALFDKNCSIHEKSKINRFVFLRNSKVDAYSFVGPNCNLLNATIGKFCSISKNINIGAPIHPTDLVSTSPIFYRPLNGTGSTFTQVQTFNDNSKPVIIENDVWIGMNSTILGGVTISNGSIIGAHSIVTKDVPPYAIVAGVPARIIKYRFTEDIIKELLSLQWWNMQTDTLLNPKTLSLFSQKPDKIILSKLKKELK